MSQIRVLAADAASDVSLFSQLGPPKNAAEREARERIDANKYDVEAWTMFTNEAESRPTAEASAMFELVLATFPTAGKYWKAYVEVQMSASKDDAVRFIFSRCLLNCFHVDLWKCYIKFIRRVNDGRGLEGREETRKAFEFMVGYIGMDIAAGPLWLDYIAWIKATPAASPQEDTQRMSAIRKVYQQAVLAPIHHVEQLWRDYENFENTINRALAKGLLGEFQPRHFAARAVYRERKKHYDQIDLNILAVPPTGSLKEEQQCAAWKQLFAFEKGNPQRVEPPLLAKRVVFTYEQCLMYFYHYPDIWHDYAMWHAQNGSNDNAAAIFRRALKALPDAAVLYYAYAEFEEARGGVKEAKRIYELLVKNDALANALAFIQLMRFVRRTEGIEAARKVFLEARKSPSCTYHLYVASAAMVLCVDKDPTRARDIFELGLKKYIHEPAYVLEYADFLCRLNDDRNVRLLFERALSVLPADESVEVWNRFLAFEQMYGDIPSMLKVAQRRKEALAQAGEEGQAVAESSLQELVSRYRFLDLWPCSAQDLDHFARQQMMAGKMEKQAAPSGATGVNKPTGGGVENASTSAVNVVRPDVSQMVRYDPKQQGNASNISPFGGVQSQQSPPGITEEREMNSTTGRSTSSSTRPPPQPQKQSSHCSATDMLRMLPPMLASFLTSLPAVAGPFPDVDMVLSMFMKSEIPTTGTTTTTSSNVKGNRNARHSQMSKRKEPEREEEENSTSAAAASQIKAAAAPRDVFRMRQLQRSRAAAAGGGGGGGGVGGGGGGGGGGGEGGGVGSGGSSSVFSGERSGASE